LLNESAVPGVLQRGRRENGARFYTVPDKSAVPEGNAAQMKQHDDECILSPDANVKSEGLPAVSRAFCMPQRS